MPVDNIVFFGTHTNVVSLHNFADNVVLRVDLRPIDSGKFVVWGRVAIMNYDGSSQMATARLTTLDGATELDRADVRLGEVSESDTQAISLQAVLELGVDQKTNTIIDLRCSTFRGHAHQASLLVMRVDELRPAGI